MTRQAVTLEVNGRAATLVLEARTTLLEALRDGLGLTGAKLGCGHGNCGACTVLIDGRPQYACLRLALDCDDQAVTTVEGLAHDGTLSRVQQAFVAHDALQCGFCTPGQVMSAEGLLQREPHPDEASIDRAMSGNLCRCGTYPRIRQALGSAAGEAP